ncbi:MAG: class I tRNA ligase family protein, partial [Eubacteriales bacterium]
DGFTCPHCGGKHFTKETDTLDGWFDSGSSHRVVIRDIKWPVDLYLEGADQYRGWFQSSLLTAVGAMGGGAPYKQVLTHGWVVDGEGKAMHKSLGNSVYPEDVIKKYGADLLRLWVASSDYRVDVRVSDDIFKQLSEIYRKIRNTTRILLANLGDPAEDFNPDTDMLPFESLEPIDKWIVSRFNALADRVRKAYNTYEFHLIYHDMHNFCAIDLSKLYIDISKDRVYVQSKTSPARRSAQTAMYTILSGFTRLIAPILSFTAEEIWQFMPHTASDNAESVFLNDMPEYQSALAFPEITEKYDKLFALRDDVMKALEIARADKKIGKSQDAEVVIYAKRDSGEWKLFESLGDELADIFICSGVELSDAVPDADAFTETVSGIAVKVLTAEGVKCDRCWFIRKDTCEDGEGGHLCRRCTAIVSAEFPSLEA